MTSHTAKSKIAKLQANQASNQAGVSLLLAVLVLAAVTAIAFSVATIVLIEIRTAGDNLRTEPNLYATLGVTEEALFQYKRGYEPADPDNPLEFNVPKCYGPANSNVCLINNVTLEMPPGTQPLDFDESPRVEYVGPNSSLVIPMYRINVYDKEYEDLDMQVFPNTGNLTLDYFFIKTDVNGVRTCYPGGAVLSTGSIACPEYGQIPVYNATESYSSGFSGSGGCTDTSPSTPCLNDGEYHELFLFNNHPTQGVSVSIVTRRIDDQEPDGLPFTGKKVLRIVADYLGLTRTYQVEIPVP